MPIQEYAIVDGDTVGKFIKRDSDAIAALPPAKRADIRPVTRTIATIDPTTQTLGPEVVSVAADAVTITRAAVNLPAATVKTNRRQIARDEVSQTPAMNRELAQTIATVYLARTQAGENIPALLQTAYSKAKPWLEHWALAEVEAIRAANAGEDPTLPTPPAEDLP